MDTMIYLPEQLEVYSELDLATLFSWHSGLDDSDVSNSDYIQCSIEQYQLLRRCSEKQDVAEWNQWRLNHPEEKILLCGADLSNFNLKNIDLSRAKLRFAICKSTNFYCGKFDGAIFAFANLQEANFSYTSCRHSLFHISNLRNANFNSAKCQKACFSLSDCRNMKMVDASCQNIDFSYAKCDNATFTKANCQDSHFSQSNCREAKFLLSTCFNADFFLPSLERAAFQNALFDSSTQFTGITIADNTNFSATNLEIPLFEPGTKAKIEHIIRQSNWREWARNTMSHISFSNFTASLKSCAIGAYVYMVMLFWFISDYGYSTKRVLFCFFWLVLLFGCLYTLYPSMLAINGSPLEQGHPTQMLLFAMSTMVTLGFSNINVTLLNGSPHLGGMLAVSANLMFGYFMLAVLVTRLAIIFQTLGPAYVIPKKKEQVDSSRCTSEEANTLDGKEWDIAKHYESLVKMKRG